MDNTTLYLSTSIPEAAYQEFRTRADDTGTSIAGVIRELLAEFYETADGRDGWTTRAVKIVGPRARRSQRMRTIQVGLPEPVFRKIVARAKHAAIGKAERLRRDTVAAWLWDRGDEPLDALEVSAGARVSFTADAEDVRWLRVRAAAQNVKMSEILKQCVRACMAEDAPIDVAQPQQVSLLN